MTPDETDAELAALEAFTARYGEGRWHVWRGDDGGDGIYHAWLLRSSPPVVLYDRKRAGLEARVTEFERVYKETSSLGRGLAAAEGLET